MWIYKNITFVLLVFNFVFSQQSNYFPLNLYDQRSYDNLAVETVIDTSIMNGKSYFLFDLYRTYNNVYFRQESSKVYFYTDSIDHLFYDFSANIGDSWVCPEPYSGMFGPMELQSTTDTVITPSGIYEGCYRFYHFIGYDYAYQEWFAPGVGLVERYNIWFYPWTMKLVEYSNITTINNNFSKIPLSHNIEPPFPNPFNSSINLSFNLYKNSIVEISIYNITGQKIKNIINNKMTSGSYNLHWNADNLSSGIYIIKYLINNNITYQNAILLK